MENIGILFIAGFGPIVTDGVPSRKLYSETLHIAFQEESGGYLHTESLTGANSFRSVAAFSSGIILLWKECMAGRNLFAAGLAGV